MVNGYQICSCRVLAEFGDFSTYFLQFLSIFHDILFPVALMLTILVSIIQIIVTGRILDIFKTFCAVFYLNSAIL